MLWSVQQYDELLSYTHTYTHTRAYPNAHKHLHIYFAVYDIVTFLGFVALFTIVV